MDPQAPLTPEALTALVHHLYQEGERATQQHEDLKANIWFSQCLLTVQSLPDHVDWVSTLLFNLGRVKALLQRPEQSLGFLEASANAQLALPHQGEAEADVAQAVGSLLGMIGYPLQGQYFLERARGAYDACGAKEKARAAEQQARQLSTKNRGARPAIAPLHHFEIRIGSEVAGRLSISDSGQIEWSDGDTLTQPQVLGVSVPWNAVCTTC